jgi:hypothetical protein
MVAHTGDVYCLALVPNIPNKDVVSFDLLSGGDYTVKLWNSTVTTRATAVQLGPNIKVERESGL